MIYLSSCNPEKQITMQSAARKLKLESRKLLTQQTNSLSQANVKAEEWAVSILTSPEHQANSKLDG